ncbi:ethanolamine utilization protein EutN [Aliishimia ponticola]|uniref:Ethanolamine utilization protein EutN n=1 Tax=Aliishimia ponticola TaxID=2499833 RepID=A0A4S4NCA7_9RHOB|nr:EutN/CcmL family microcompartment protein [Aliishimia ponticola]THH37052.1 ethanolamine utilization protein EutN [Aliishimia ponticola]
MKLARVTGTVTATAKDAQLVGLTLLLCDVVDGKGKVLEPAVVAADTVGAGVGAQVLIVTGSAARLPARTTGVPVDAVITAIVDHVDLG